MNNLSKVLSYTVIIIIWSFSSIKVCADNQVATLRKGVKLETQAPPESIASPINNDVKQTRNYPMQPPLIPHKIRNYEVNLNSNKCMTCHSRNRTQSSQAPMVSVTHFMDRDGNFLAEISPRRYFCQQCHAVQTDATPLVENTFVDMHHLMKVKDKND